MLIHIGYHKTGTSWLQKHFFRNTDSAFYSPIEPVEYIEDFIICNPFDYDEEKVAEKYENIFSTENVKSKIPTLSHEMLSGNPWKGEYPGYATATRLKNTFPDAKILIVIREQVSMISSLYRHRVRAGEVSSISRYLADPIQGSGWEPIFQKKYIEYHWLVRHYQNLFGENQVLVLPYEMIKKDQALFLKRIEKFCNLEASLKVSEQNIVNSGYSYLCCRLRRPFNKVLKHDLAVGKEPLLYRAMLKLFDRLNSKIPDKIQRKSNKHLLENIRTLTAGQYKNSNAILQTLIDVDLKKYGYDL